MSKDNSTTTDMNVSKTRYFEVTKRDGSARIGKLRELEKIVHTPCIIDVVRDPVISSCSIWNENIQRNNLTILPYIPLPLDVPVEYITICKQLLDANSPVTLRVADQREASQYYKQPLDVKSPATGVVIHPKGDIPEGFDVYVLGASADLANNPRAFTAAIIRTREHITPDSALYAPAIATSYNLALLIFSGIDIIDYTRATIDAYKDLYFTKVGSRLLQNLKELPCRCPACCNHTPASLLQLQRKERARLLEQHNRTMMDQEVALVKQLINEGHLRDYMEGVCRVEAWQTGALQHFDLQYIYLEKRTPVVRRVPLYACTAESLNRVEVQRFAERVQDRYTPPERDILLLLPCSAKKPYSASMSHQRISHHLGKLRRSLHEVIITSPLGIVPRELELTYPAAHYDIPVTGHWSSDERTFVEECLSRYLTKHPYQTIIAHVSYAYKEICEEVASKLSREIIFTAQDNILSKSSLDNLKERIQSSITNITRSVSAADVKKELMRAIADYQFGESAGIELIPDGSIIKSHYPKHQVYYDNKQLATLIPQYGTLALTLHGARRVAALNRYTVIIDEFIPTGSILAAGVIDADKNIREGDEVFVRNTQVFAVGRAQMSGEEMIRSTRGLAIDLRHTAKVSG